MLVSSDISLERSDNPFIVSIKSIETVNISPFSSPIAACAGFCNISYPVTSFIIVLVPLNTPQPLYLRNLIVASPKVTPTAASSSPGIGVAIVTKIANAPLPILIIFLVVGGKNFSIPALDICMSCPFCTILSLASPPCWHINSDCCRSKL